MKKTITSESMTDSGNDFERNFVLDAVDAEIGIESKNAREIKRFGGGDEGGVGQVHGDVLVLLHEVVHPLPIGRIVGMNCNDVSFEERPEHGLALKAVLASDYM